MACGSMGPGLADQNHHSNNNLRRGENKAPTAFGPVYKKKTGIQNVQGYCRIWSCI